MGEVANAISATALLMWFGAMWLGYCLLKVADAIRGRK